jgi:hypothetical protein
MSMMPAKIAAIAARRLGCRRIVMLSMSATRAG